MYMQHKLRRPQGDRPQSIEQVDVTRIRVVSQFGDSLEVQVLP